MSKSPPHPLLKLAIEAGPLVVFFIGNSRFGIFWATAAFMVAIVISLGLSFALERKLPLMPLVTAFFVLIFGGLTLFLEDDFFIKIKPTVVNSLFAIILAGGMLMGRPLLKPLLGAMLPLDDRGWGILTWRWAAFFVVLAVLNEVVWRTQPTDTWVTFKTFGVMPITVVFALSQIPLMRRHGLEDA